MGSNLLLGLTRLVVPGVRRLISPALLGLHLSHRVMFTPISPPQERSNQPPISYKIESHLPRKSDFNPKEVIWHVNPLFEEENDDKRNYNVVLWLLLRPLAKLFAMIAGKGARSAYDSMTPEHREQVLNVIQTNSMAACIALAIFVILARIYYVYHMEETPIVKRKRYVSFSEQDVKDLSEIEAEHYIDVFKSRFLLKNDPKTTRALRVAKKLVDTNPEVAQISKEWNIYIIDEPFVNAFVLSTGHVFVFKGIIDISASDDQLAVIMGHEMAHAVLNHVLESLSLDSFVDWFLVLGIATIWFLIKSEILDVLVTALLTTAVDWSVKLPASRVHEVEADHVGLLFAAKACYNIHEAGDLWRKIAKLQEPKGWFSWPSWLATHPSSHSRADYLDSMGSVGDRLRAISGCFLPQAKKN